jgi:uncharacterized protein (TIGR02117 family)
LSASKAAIRGLRRVLAGAIAVAAFAVLAAFVPRPLFPVEAAGGGVVEIFVASNPIHSDIIIPFDDVMRKEFAFLKAGNGADWFDNPNVRFISFGWGGRAFYLETPTWDRLQAVPLFKGLTIDNAVMHVEPLGEIFPGNPNVTPLRISAGGLVSLRKEIRASFMQGADQAPMLIAGKSYGQSDDFYEATGHFNALLGCNTWAARMLRVAGLRTGLWNPLPQSLRLSLKLYN